MDRKTFDSLLPGDVVRIVKFGAQGTNSDLAGRVATVIEKPGKFDIQVDPKAKGWSLCFCEPAEIELVVRVKDKYPHTCNRMGCGGAAYVGAYDVDCSKCGRH